jgi:predicted MFS family arabinose efflux permease
LTVPPSRPPDPPSPAEPSSWTLVWALAGAQLVSWGVLYYAFALFIVPMEEELGWSRAELNGALTAGLLASSFSAYPIGAWIDKHGGRALMTAGSILGVLLVIAWSQVQSLPAFVLIWIGIGIAQAATLYAPVFVVLTRIFSETFRTKITVLTLVGGFASTVFLPLTQVLIEMLGWRHALLVLAGIVAITALPVHALILRDAPRRGVGVPTLSGREAVRKAMATATFWGLFICYFAYYAAFTSMTFHLVPLLSDRGFSAEMTVAVYMLVGPAQVAGRVLLLTVARRMEAAVAGIICMVLIPISILILIFFPGSFPMLVVFALIYGVANGIMTIVRGTAVPDLMWREGYGAINGVLAMSANIAQALSPFAAALLWEFSGGYSAVLWAVLASSIIAAVAFWLAVRLRPAARA